MAYEEPTISVSAVVKYWPVLLGFVALVGMAYLGNYRLSVVEQTVNKINDTENWQTYAVLRQTVADTVSDVKIHEKQLEFQREETRALKYKIEQIEKACSDKVAN